ncbi:putative glutamate--cysteine ligase 2 [Sphaerisporangium siamense]|uniref:Putative glutamate--cysteine ligase 2 n=1 Tax=Sphaerisporangium siamense TaxID=795645 RepID=A0A7W7DD01_9ACTN|nr:glutamate--cysteine ligase [Sphaerisporangium siamense]MBB4704269.1 carboxylate-amine ligase [Sphaerisporangium siamense]GII85049.1 putative glutamate--cysteine ligase 2 [Sphaerisporangium siamense]
MDEQSENRQVQYRSPVASAAGAHHPPAEDPRPPGDGATLGVEEEFLLVDPCDGVPTLANARVLADLAEPVDPAGERRAGASGAGNADVESAGHTEDAEYKAELLASMMESISPVCTSLHQLRARLISGRRRLADAATRAGVRAVATGTPVVPGRAPREVSAKSRYREMRELYGLLVTQQETCGCHVHVGVADRETAVAVANRIRPWLPTLLALSVNSPFCEGVDTGYASWRTVALSRWPATDIPPRFSSAAHYDRVTAMLHAGGALVAAAHPYWLVRPSGRFPTVEIRAADVAATVDEAVLQAALSRALVRTALADPEDPPVPDEDQILKAALWAAARYGLAGGGVHPRTGKRVPAMALLEEMLAWIGPALRDLGDEEETVRLLADLTRTGTGADRQRALAAPGLDQAALQVIDAFDLAKTTP